MKLVIDIPEILLDRIKSAKCVPDMYGSDIVNTVVCVRDGTPYAERERGKWETKTIINSRTGEKEIYSFCPCCGASYLKEGDKK